MGFPGDRPDAGRGRRRQGRAPGRALAGRRRPRTGWLLCDDGRLPAVHGRSAVDRRAARSAVAVEAGRPRSALHAQRGHPPDPRRSHPPRRCGGGDHARARAARRAGRLRRPIQRDGGGLADGLLRGPAGHVSQRRGAGGDPRARAPVLGVALHRAGRDLPPAERIRPAEGPHGRGRAADGLPGQVRRAFCSRPTPSPATGRSPPSRPASASAKPWSPASSTRTSTRCGTMRSSRRVIAVKQLGRSRLRCPAERGDTRSIRGAGRRRR